MENENNKEQPKPTDDVQLDIETVVPAAHEAEVTPGKTETPEEVKENQPKDTLKEGDKVTEGEEGQEEPVTATDKAEKNEDLPADEEMPEGDEKTGNAAEGEQSPDADEPQNGIETVTP